MEPSSYTSAAERIRGHIRHTPLVAAAPSRWSDAADLWFKHECLQVSGSAAEP
jgi:threonine dehydratase